MPGGSDVERSREYARDEVGRLLGIGEIEPQPLLDLAGDVLGERRAQRCLRLLRRAPLTQRGAETAHVAALIVGTRELGEGWWERSGDAMLGDAASEDLLPALSQRICDDCADARWGTPIGDVDIDDPRRDDRVALPADAAPGDCFVAAFGPGCRVVVDVVERDGLIGSVLGELRFGDAEDARWAWEMAADIGPIRLPDEIPGVAGDPFALCLRPDVARRLRTWAGEHEPDGDVLGAPWRTRADLWEARFRLGLPYERGDDWYPFEIVARAAVDGDDERLGYALARLDMF